MKANVSKTLTTVGLLAAVVLAASACSSATATPASSSPAVCASVSTDLSSAQTQLTTDQNKADKDKGTPDSASDVAKIKSDQDKINALKEQQSACAASSSASATPVVSATPSPTATPTIDPAILAALTVSTSSVRCLDIVGAQKVTVDGTSVVVFHDNIGALKGLPPRKWSDSISTPFTVTVPSAMLAEVETEICLDPLYGSMVANHFANLKIGNVSVADLNPWLQPFVGDASTVVSQQAATYLPLLGASSATPSEQQSAVSEDLAWQYVAERLDTLLGKYDSSLGVKSMQSTLNYHLQAGGLMAGGLPIVELNSKQENLPALVFQLTEKGACAPLDIIGFNVGDKRLEEFAPPTCTKPKPTSTPKVKVSPSPKPKPTPTPSKTPTPTPTPARSTQPPCTTCTTAPPPPCHCTPPPCPLCVTKASASPTVDTHPPAQPSTWPSTEPTPNPTVSLNQAPSATPGGYNSGTSKAPSSGPPDNTGQGGSTNPTPISNPFG